MQGAAVGLCGGSGYVRSVGSAASKSDWLQPRSRGCPDCPCNLNCPQVCKVAAQSFHHRASVSVTVAVIVPVTVSVSIPSLFLVTVTVLFLVIVTL